MPPLRSAPGGTGSPAAVPDEEPYLYPGGTGAMGYGEPAPAPAPAYAAAAYDAAQYGAGNAYSTGTPAAEAAWSPPPAPPPAPTAYEPTPSQRAAAQYEAEQYAAGNASSTGTPYTNEQGQTRDPYGYAWGGAASGTAYRGGVPGGREALNGVPLPPPPPPAWPGPHRRSFPPETPGGFMMGQRYGSPKSPGQMYGFPISIDRAGPEPPGYRPPDEYRTYENPPPTSPYDLPPLEGDEQVVWHWPGHGYAVVRGELAPGDPNGQPFEKVAAADLPPLPAALQANSALLPAGAVRIPVGQGYHAPQPRRNRFGTRASNAPTWEAMRDAADFLPGLFGGPEPGAAPATAGGFVAYSSHGGGFAPGAPPEITVLRAER